VAVEWLQAAVYMGGVVDGEARRVLDGTGVAVVETVIAVDLGVCFDEELVLGCLFEAAIISTTSAVRGGRRNTQSTKNGFE
jgi:hypothetical protein